MISVIANILFLSREGQSSIYILIDYINTAVDYKFSEMKNKLAVFDFDYTIKEQAPGLVNAGGLAKLFPNQELPKEYLKILKEQGLAPFCSAVGKAANELEGITKDDVINAVTNDGHLVEGVLNYLSNS